MAAGVAGFLVVGVRRTVEGRRCELTCPRCRQCAQRGFRVVEPPLLEEIGIEMLVEVGVVDRERRGKPGDYSVFGDDVEVGGARSRDLSTDRAPFGEGAVERCTADPPQRLGDPRHGFACGTHLFGTQHLLVVEDTGGRPTVDAGCRCVVVVRGLDELSPGGEGGSSSSARDARSPTTIAPAGSSVSMPSRNERRPMLRFASSRVMAMTSRMLRPRRSMPTTTVVSPAARSPAVRSCPVDGPRTEPGRRRRYRSVPDQPCFCQCIDLRTEGVCSRGSRARIRGTSPPARRLSLLPSRRGLYLKSLDTDLRRAREIRD